jgi:hypothetical protein
MPKGDHTIISTTLDVDRVRGILSTVLSGATVESLNQGPLDEEAAIAILASQRGGVAFKKSPFGPGNAVAQVVVEDRGATRRVELISIQNTFADNWNGQRAARGAIAGLSAVKEAPNPKAGRKMVGAILQALQAADPSLQQTQ